jgi:hypothetical protein
MRYDAMYVVPTCCETALTTKKKANNAPKYKKIKAIAIALYGAPSNMRNAHNEMNKRLLRGAYIDIV